MIHAGLRVAAIYEQAIREADSADYVQKLRVELGEVIELLRSVGQTAIRREAQLKAEDETAFQQALKTAGIPSATWPPVKIRITYIRPNEGC